MRRLWIAAAAVPLLMTVAGCSQLPGATAEAHPPSRPEQVDRVPDAVVRDESVNDRRKDHGDAAGNAALDPAEDRIGFNGQMRAMFGTNLQPLHLAPRRFNRDRLHNHRQIFVGFMRQHLAKPSDAAGDHQNAAEGAHPVGRDQAGESHHAAKGEDDRPGGWRGRRRGCCFGTWCGSGSCGGRANAGCKQHEDGARRRSRQSAITPKRTRRVLTAPAVVPSICGDACRHAAPISARSATVGATKLRSTSMHQRRSDCAS